MAERSAVVFHFAWAGPKTNATSNFSSFRLEIKNCWRSGSIVPWEKNCLWNVIHEVAVSILYRWLDVVYCVRSHLHWVFCSPRSWRRRSGEGNQVTPWVKQFSDNASDDSEHFNARDVATQTDASSRLTEKELTVAAKRFRSLNWRWNLWIRSWVLRSLDYVT